MNSLQTISEKSLVNQLSEIQAQRHYSPSSWGNNSRQYFAGYAQQYLPGMTNHFTDGGKYCKPEPFGMRLAILFR